MSLWKAFADPFDDLDSFLAIFKASAAPIARMAFPVRHIQSSSPLYMESGLYLASYGKPATQCAQGECKMTLQMSTRWNPGFLNAMKSSLKVPNVVAGRSFKPS